MRFAHPLCLLPILALTSNCGLEGKQSPATELAKLAPTPQVSPQISVQKPDQALPIKKQWKNTFTFKMHDVSEKHEGYCPYEISVEYPEALGRDRKAKRFNKWIKRKVLADVARFRNLELRAEPRAKKAGKRLVTEALELTFNMYYSDDRLISFRITHRVMAAGQMHPINYYETINYDLGKQRTFRARDLFRRGYLKVFSDYSRKYLQDTYEIPNDDWFVEGTTPSVRNFGNWNVVPDGILISFEDYQVSSHSFGQPELIVPYSDLRKVLRRQGITHSF